jgi:hypothetical protein
LTGHGVNWAGQWCGNITDDFAQNFFARVSLLLKPSCTHVRGIPGSIPRQIIGFLIYLSQQLCQTNKSTLSKPWYSVFRQMWRLMIVIFDNTREVVKSDK